MVRDSTVLSKPLPIAGKKLYSFVVSVCSIAFWAKLKYGPKPILPSFVVVISTVFISLFLKISNLTAVFFLVDNSLVSSS